jgi:hypothetical protein
MIKARKYKEDKDPFPSFLLKKANGIHFVGNTTINTNFGAVILESTIEEPLSLCQPLITCLYNKSNSILDRVSKHTLITREKIPILVISSSISIKSIISKTTKATLINSTF